MNPENGGPGTWEDHWAQLMRYTGQLTPLGAKLYVPRKCPIDPHEAGRGARWTGPLQVALYTKIQDRPDSFKVEVSWSVRPDIYDPGMWQTLAMPEHLQASGLYWWCWGHAYRRKAMQSCMNSLLRGYGIPGWAEDWLLRGVTPHEAGIHGHP